MQQDYLEKGWIARAKNIVFGGFAIEIEWMFSVFCCITGEGWSTGIKWKKGKVFYNEDYNIDGMGW